ncbi:MAG TPA: alpha/beta hydrolase [Thermoleophilaceae bacterium]|nr:alpha/beta hydrolase [Thermoleophilaceae bacterium]
MSELRPANRLIDKAHQTLATVYPSKARPAAPWEAHRAPRGYGAPVEPDWREIDWPPLVRRAQLSTGDMTYVDLGDGDDPPIVFLHGLGGQWQNWLENIPRAAQERRTIAVDLPGFGTSPMPTEDISVSLYARLVEELLEQLGIESAVIVGNSMGGFVGADLCIQYPARVDQLVLAAACGISTTSLRQRPVMTAFSVAGVISSATLARSYHVVARPRLRHPVLASVIRHPLRLRPDVLLQIMPGSNNPGFMPALESLLEYDLTDRLGEIHCPTLLVWGREDVLVPVADADEYERLIPDARKVVFDETGHMPMLERPGEFNDALMGFVSAESVGAPTASADARSDGAPAETSSNGSAPAVGERAQPVSAP